MPSPTNASEFYIGRRYDLEAGEAIDQPVLYDPADLTTHGVVTGMTGSGKTGLCIGLLEEAALNGVPAIIVDPKGDLTNLLLHFPNLAESDFAPWIDPEDARRQGKDVAALAGETAKRWKDGLAQWGIGPERISALQSAADFAVYTPGSDAGLPLSILASLNAPEIPWEGNREVLRERIASTVTALLGLVGLTGIDPVRSREHILLANVFEAAWSQGKDLTLEDLILQTQTPPFTKLGVFPVETFFPEKDRFGLAMLLNNFLAAPSFQTWMEGQPLEVAGLLFTPDGKPRHSIFYLAHLSEAERMFFVTLLFSSVETWMRTQSGTSGLRALLYFDEIVGYLPPVENPPSKPILLRLLKQARAFGVGLLLATQNPVDVDYKALSNAGTWFIGKLQTDQDKQRLLDGLQSASGGLDRAAYDRLISALGKRVFLLHNVHAPGPVVFQTRWTMNFLAGPLTRTQIPALNRLAAALPSGAAPASTPMPEMKTAPAGVSASPTAAVIPAQPAAQPAAADPRRSEQEEASEGTATRPAVPASVREYAFPNNLTFSEALKRVEMNAAAAAAPELLYRPALLAQADVRYLARKYNLDFNQKRAALVTRLDRRGQIRWEDFPYPAADPGRLDARFAPNARYAALDSPLTDAKLMASIEKDFQDWAYRTSGARIKANETLKVYVPPEASTADFRELCSQAARQACQVEIEKIGATYDTKLRALQEKLAREQRELGQDEDELNQRKMEELGTAAETIFGLLGGRKRRVSTSLTKHRLTQQAKSDVEESRQTIAAHQKEIARLEAEKNKAIQEVNDRWAKAALETAELSLTPMKKDVYTEVFGLVWMPFYVIRDGDKVVELPAFE